MVNVKNVSLAFQNKLLTCSEIKSLGWLLVKIILFILLSNVDSNPFYYEGF